MLSIVFGEFHYAWNKCIFFEMYWLYFSHVCLFNVLFNWTKFKDLAGVARADQGSVKGIAYFYVGNGKGVAYFFKVHRANSNSL